MRDDCQAQSNRRKILDNRLFQANCRFAAEPGRQKSPLSRSNQPNIVVWRKLFELASRGTAFAPFGGEKMGVFAPELCCGEQSQRRDLLKRHRLRYDETHKYDESRKSETPRKMTPINLSLKTAAPIAARMIKRRLSRPIGKAKFRNRC